jgi:hypothetical protein
MRIGVLCLFFIALLSGCVRHTVGSSLKTTDQKATGQKLQRVLIMGGGSMPTRIFLEELSNELTGLFKTSDIQTEVLMIDSHSQTDSIDYDRFDAFLVFNSTTKAKLNMTRLKFTLVFVDAADTYGSHFIQTFKTTLYQRDEWLELVWEGDLKVNVDLTKGKQYKEAAKLIYTELRKKSIITDPVK